MKRLCLGLLKLLGLVTAAGLAATAFAFLVLAPQYANEYAGAMQDKVDRLLSIQGPKIILVGNSNLAFGIDSPTLEAALDYPVVNLGFHGALSDATIERFAKMNIGAGDIVVVSQTAYVEIEDDPSYLFATLENHWSLYQAVAPENIWLLIKALPKYVERLYLRALTGTGREEVTDAYGRSAFNEYGDDAYPRSESLYVFTPGSVSLVPISAACTQRLNAFDAYCRERGAFLVIAAYPLPECPYTPSRETVAAFQQELADQLTCPVISDFNEYRLDPSCFYDTHCHLTNRGAKLRTEQLARDLLKWLAAERTLEQAS